MAATDLAKAYVQIIPSTKDFSANLAAALGPELSAAGLGAGQTLGASMANGAVVAKLGLAAAGAAAVKFGADAVKAGIDFDTAMSQVQATLLADKSEMAELRAFAQEMGSTTKFTATQAAEALNYMALAGYDANTSMEMLPTVLNLAAAGSMDLARASDMVTDAQTALGLNIEQTRVMVDQMAKAASRSNTSVAQLGDAMLTIGGTAQYMAGGTTELTTVLGVLADNGIKAGEGGTHLRNMLLRLVDPTEHGRDALDKLGVSIFDADGKMRSFAEIFPELADAMDELTDEQRLEYMGELFNTRDIAAANALLETTRERWEELGGAIDDAAGSAEAMAEIQLDNLEGSVTKLKSAYEGLQITIADKVTPAMKTMVDNATYGIQQLNSLITGGLAGYKEAILEHGGEFIAMDSTTGHTFSTYKHDIPDVDPVSSVNKTSQTINNFYVEQLNDVNQLMDMIENDNRRRRMGQ